MYIHKYVYIPNVYCIYNTRTYLYIVYVFRNLQYVYNMNLNIYHNDGSVQDRIYCVYIHICNVHIYSYKYIHL